MSTQENRDVPCETILKNFLENINTHNLYNFSHNPNVLATRFRNGKRATGRNLMQRVVHQEARRLQITQNLAREINRINDRNNRRQDVNADTLNRITQIGVQQVTNTPFETDFYNGIQFDKVDLLPWEFPGSPFP